MVSDLLQAMGEPLRDDFLDRLVLAGYHQIHEAHYRLYGYLFRFSRVYRVDNQFPQIKQGELRSGVSDVSYSSDLSNINPVSGEIEEIEGALFSEQG